MNYMQSYYLENKDKINARNRAYYQAHKEEVLARVKRQYHENPEKYKAANRGWYYVHSKQQNKLRNNRTTALRVEIFNLLGGKCIKCEFEDYRALQFDHINGGGTQERKSLRNRWAYLKHVKNNIDNYQLLCANCNWIKRWERKEYN